MNLSLELTRDEYEAMIAPFVEETLEAVHAALKSAEMTASDVEAILLIGGATRTPLIRRRLHEVFGKVPRGEVDADLSVALGAAIEGAAMTGAEVSAVLVDVTPYTFGTKALAELDGELYPYTYVPVIAANTPIPVRKSEIFYTVMPNQPAVDVHIYQGEDPDALRNIELGEFRIEGLSKAPAGNPVVLDLALDRDGILHVAAREKSTGLERRITIEKAMPRYGQAELEQAKDRIGALFGPGDPASGAGADPMADDGMFAPLLAKAKARLDSVSDEDRNDLIDLMETIEEARRQGRAGDLEQARARLEDLLFYLDV